jgi:Peptidase U49
MIKINFHLGGPVKPDTPIKNLKIVMEPLEAQIRMMFLESQLKVDLEVVELIIGDPVQFASGNLNVARTVFEAVPSLQQVRVTWDGLASLWLAAFAVLRLGSRSFNARRNGQSGLPEDDDLKAAIKAIETSQSLTKSELREWPAGVPIPTSTPASVEEDQVRRLFLGSLNFILSHERAHLSLGHQATDTVDIMKANEFAADRQAGIWLKGERQADPDRCPGATPTSEELELEGYALRVGIALIWIALFEQHNGQSSSDHPEISTRFDKVLQIFGLSDDSGAAEILSDTIKGWLDRLGNWDLGKDPAKATARAALDEAVWRLHSRLAPGGS